MAGSLKPKTYLGHPNQEKMRIFLRKLFEEPDLVTMDSTGADFFSKTRLPMDDFPICEQMYSRTILYRAENGFECMAARWNKGASSVIHGHPMFAFYYVVEGELSVDTFENSGDELVSLDTQIYGPEKFFSITGVPMTFDNAIHRVTAKEDTLSLHIYSDDAMKGEVFL